ncbi:MAG: hypothetical protein AAGM22_32595 [Acidobacteriota bacterium]
MGVLAIVGIVKNEPKVDAKGQFECYGTRHFAPGARVYVLPPEPSYDMGSGRVRVLGFHRETGEVTKIWFRIVRASQWKVEIVDDPEICSYWSGEWTPSEAKGLAKFFAQESQDRPEVDRGK